MGGTNKTSVALAIFAGVITYIMETMVENTVFDACFSIINDMADYASQFSPATGFVIRSIPLFIAAITTYMALQGHLMKKIGNIFAQIDY